MEKKVIATTAAPAAIGPYSQGIDLGSLMFCSGQLPVDPSTGVMPADIAGQTRQCLTNIKSLLAEAGLGMEHVVKTTVYLQNMSEFATMNEVYGSFFNTASPARSTVEVAKLPKDALVEIEAIAAR